MIGAIRGLSPDQSVDQVFFAYGIFFGFDHLFEHGFAIVEGAAPCAGAGVDDVLERDISFFVLLLVVEGAEKGDLFGAFQRVFLGGAILERAGVLRGGGQGYDDRN